MSATAKTLRTSCPSCGGTVPRSESSRAERCPYCSHRSLLWSKDPEEIRYSLAPVFDGKEALERARTQLLSHKVLPKRLADEVVFEEPILYFVPYLWYTATRPAIIKRAKRVVVDLDAVLDTKVVVDDFEAFRLAVEMPGWGLEGLDIGALITGEEAPLMVPFDGTALRRQGLVLTPQRGYDDLQSWARFGFPQNVEADVSPAPIAERRRVLFVPFWSVGYDFEGYHYEARVDAMAGELRSARGPEDHVWRIPMALLAAALPCFVLGKLLRASAAFIGAEMGATLMNPGLILTGAAALVFGLFLFIACLSVAWSLLRFEADVVFERGVLWSEQLGKIEEGWLGRLASKSTSLLAELVSGVKKNDGASKDRRSRGDR